MHLDGTQAILTPRETMHVTTRRSAIHLVWLISGTLQGATYVAPGGDDGAPGTPALPKRTIKSALAALAPGDTLFLLGGVYDASGQSNANLFGLSTSASDVLISAAPGESAIIDFAGTSAPGGAAFFDDQSSGDRATIASITFASWLHDRPLLRIDDADDTTIRDCVFEGVEPPPNVPIVAVDGVTHTVLERCTFGTRSDASLYFAVRLDGDGTPGEERYVVRDCTFNDDDALGDELGRGAGILATLVDDLEITGCSGVNAGSNRGPQSPFHFVELRGVRGALVSDIAFKRYLGEGTGTHPLHDADGIKVGSFAGIPSSNVTIQRCELWGTGHGVHVGNDSRDIQLTQVWCDSTYDDCVFVNDGASDVEITNVVSHFSQDNGIDVQGDGVTISACTIVRPHGSAVNIWSTAAGVTVSDVLVHDVRDLTVWPYALVFVDAVSGWSFDHDAWHEPGGEENVFRLGGANETFAAWQGAGQDPNGLFGVDPGFCDPDARAWPIFSDGFRVSSSSPVATASSTGGPIGAIAATCAPLFGGEDVVTPAGPRIIRAHPNPAASRTIVTAPGERSLLVVDAAGRRVVTLAIGADGRTRWDGLDRDGTPLAAGVYFLRGDTGITGRVVVAR